MVKCIFYRTISNREMGWLPFGSTCLFSKENVCIKCNDMFRGAMRNSSKQWEVVYKTERIHKGSTLSFGNIRSSSYK